MTDSFYIHHRSAYGRSTYLWVGDQVACREWIERKFKNGLPPVANARACNFIHTSTDGSLVDVIWMPYFDATPSSMALLAHEVLHATFAQLEAVGMTHCMASEEAYTYLLQDILQTFLIGLHKNITKEHNGKQRRKCN